MTSKIYIGTTSRDDLSTSSSISAEIEIPGRSMSPQKLDVCETVELPAIAQEHAVHLPVRYGCQ